MRAFLLLLVAHVVGIAVLFGVGLLLNDALKAYGDNYQGVVTVLSASFGIYCFAVSIIYHRNERVYLWVNRLLLLVRRIHTYWLPDFDFTLSAMALSDRQELFHKVESALEALPYKKLRGPMDTPNVRSITIDETFFLRLRIDESHLHVTLDRRILVPAHLYETYRQRLARIAESIANAIKPESVRLGMSITFGDGVANPYYGLFVRRVPSQLLRHFEATFLLAQDCSCRIEAGTDSINIEGTSAVQFFEALAQVLALKAIPMGGTFR
jgi:hypothetical protein